MNDLMIIALAGFTTGTTTVLFGFGGGFVVVPFVYQLMVGEPQLGSDVMH
ncbi:sulfite exporter TauE/SafE family protein, partial [Escherichia coli]|nr:sulfite exporter TauE/SafE family protein [Escherichia coli]